MRLLPCQMGGQGDVCALRLAPEKYLTNRPKNVIMEAREDNLNKKEWQKHTFMRKMLGEKIGAFYSHTTYYSNRLPCNRKITMNERGLL